MTRRRLLLTVALVVALVAGTATIALSFLIHRSPSETPPSPLIFIVDPTVDPSVEGVEPIEGRTEQRKVGALAAPDGAVAELVLDEVIVHVADAAQLRSFLDRWNGQVLDSFPPDSLGQDHLIRVDTSRADITRLPADLLATEPGQAGEHRASDERVLRLLALAAAEWKAGTELVVDWLVEPVGITDGQVYESEDITTEVDGKEVRKNVFDWSYMRTGGNLDIGVAAAWQLLEAHGKLKPQVRYMVLDGGFSVNFDFPKNPKIRKGEWGKKNPHNCSNGKSCPYHGTDVVLAAMATVNNEYGTAGPAGPVVSQLIAVGNDYDYWTRLRRLEDMVAEEHPDVVNLSFTHRVDAGGAYAERWTDRRMRHVRDHGALIVAAAGNNGENVDVDRLYVPCESQYVMCVGGLSRDSTAVSADSNFGTGDSPTSVEIYGPMCVRTINDPNKSALDFTTRDTCGTSFASPFVGGVAALVMAADPDLGPEDVRKILNDTANVGGLGSKVTGSQRRVNALRAVARALGVEVVPPVVKIDAPAPGKQLKVENWVDLRGSATDFMGRTVKIHWASDRDGDLTDGSKTSVPPLSEGKHVITASATDSTGRTSSATVTVEVVDTPPQVKVVSPAPGLEVTEGDDVALVADSIDPDTWQQLPTGKGQWEVRRGTTVVHTADGHTATLTGSKVTPGSYTARFTVDGVSAQASFTVKALPPGQDKPVAVITKPTKAVSIGNGESITFSGTGTDPTDGALPGTRYRWVATSGAVSKVLCEGSSLSRAPAPGGILLPRNCASFTVKGSQIGIANGDIGYTQWTVTLYVYDLDGNRDSDTVKVGVQYHEG